MIAGLIDDTVQALRSAGVDRGAVGRAGPRDRARRPSIQLQAPVGEWLKDDPELTDETLRERV